MSQLESEFAALVEKATSLGTQSNSLFASMPMDSAFWPRLRIATMLFEVALLVLEGRTTEAKADLRYITTKMQQTGSDLGRSSHPTSHSSSEE